MPPLDPRDEEVFTNPVSTLSPSACGSASLNDTITPQAVTARDTDMRSGMVGTLVGLDLLPMRRLSMMH